jgi:superfamily II DNA or RNA helicase
MQTPRGLVKIRKDELGLAARDLIKNNLTVVPESTSSFKQFVDPIRLWVDDGEHLCVPRGYYNAVIKKRFQPQADFKWSAGACELRPNTPISLREGQEETISAAISEMKQNEFGGAIIEAKVASGKTIIAMELARRLGMKTLFVVHTSVLMEQWIKEIRRFMPNWSVGKIQASTCDTKNNDVCVGMLQSLAMGEDYPDWVYDEFGLIVFDEVHTCGSAEFKKALFKFRSKYMLGLSGTLKRKDRAENVFKYGIGTVVSAVGKIAAINPTVYMVDTGHVWTKGTGELDRQKNNFLKAITEDTARNELIVQNTIKAALSGRHVLVLSERVGHVESLFRILLTRLLPHGIKVGMMVGSSTREQREAAIEAQVIVATVQLLSVGFNQPRLDTLVMATPVQSFDQAIGRVTRIHPDKKPPIVVDLVDSGSKIGKVFSLSRLKKYRAKNDWKIVVPPGLFK